MANVAIESGDGLGFVARVRSDGSMGVAVNNTVSTQPAQGTVTRTSATVTTGAAQLVAANSSRRQIQIQNLSGANAIHIRLGGTASTSDIRIDPGQIYSFPTGTSFTGEIGAVSVGGDAAALLIEFNG